MITPFKIDANVLQRLGCPACHGGLRLEDSRLICVACGRAYPIVNDIPVLIAERTDHRQL